jgi:hypothetical protein
MQSIADFVLLAYYCQATCQRCWAVAIVVVLKLGAVNVNGKVGSGTFGCDMTNLLTGLLLWTDATPTRTGVEHIISSAQTAAIRALPPVHGRV